MPLCVGWREFQHVRQSRVLLANSANELERLRLQARVWEPEVEIWLDSIGVQPGWRCLDMGCGAMGVLGPLSRRVGSHGSVVRLDRDVQQLAAARAYVSENRLANVEIVEADAYASSLPSNSFDFVHARFLIGPAGRADVLLPELQRVTKPGGIIGLQEPDTGSWTCYPPDQSWDALKSAISDRVPQGWRGFGFGSTYLRYAAPIGTGERETTSCNDRPPGRASIHEIAHSIRGLAASKDRGRRAHERTGIGCVCGAMREDRSRSGYHSDQLHSHTGLWAEAAGGKEPISQYLFYGANSLSFAREVRWWVGSGLFNALVLDW